MPDQHESPSDSDLLSAAGQRDTAAFAALVSRHQAALFRYARALTHREADAEDVLQRTFLAAWRGASTYQARASVRGWLFVIARHEAQRYGRVPTGAPHQDELDDISELGLAAGWGDPEQHTLHEEHKALLERALAALSAEEREILLLRELEGVPGEDAAAIIGLSVPAMKSRLHRARLRLLEALKEVGYER